MSQTCAAAGGTGSVNVAAGAGCGRTAVSNATWIHVTSGASGTGSGIVRYSVDAGDDGAGFELTPTLSPFANLHDEITVLSGLSHRQADTLGDDRRSAAGARDRQDVAHFVDRDGGRFPDAGLV